MISLSLTANHSPGFSVRLQQKSNTHTHKLVTSVRRCARSRGFVVNVSQRAVSRRRCSSVTADRSRVQPRPRLSSLHPGRRRMRSPPRAAL